VARKLEVCAVRAAGARSLWARAPYSLEPAGKGCDLKYDTAPNRSRHRRGLPDLDPEQAKHGSGLT
jgi:hypothetical protein